MLADVDGRPLTISGEGHTVRVEFAKTPGFLSVWQTLPGTWRSRAMLARMARRLDAVGLTVEVAADGEVLSRLGRAAKPGRMASALGLDHVELHLKPMMLASIGLS